MPESTHPADLILRGMLDTDRYMLRVFDGVPAGWEAAEAIPGLDGIPVRVGEHALRAQMGVLADRVAELLTLDSSIASHSGTAGGARSVSYGSLLHWFPYWLLMSLIDLADFVARAQVGVVRAFHATAFSRGDAGFPAAAASSGFRYCRAPRWGRVERWRMDS